MEFYEGGYIFFKRGYTHVKRNCHMYDAISSLIWFSRAYSKRNFRYFIDGGLSYYLASFFKLCVMIYVFLGGYGNYHTFSYCKSMRETIWCLIGRIKKLYINYWKVFLIFIPLLYIFNYYVVDLGTFFKGFVGISHTYNSEWWFFFPYVVVVCLYAVGFKFFSIKGKGKRMLIEPKLYVFGDIIGIV